MENSLPQPIFRPVPVVDLHAHSGTDHPPSTPARPPAQDEAQQAGSLIVAAPVAVAVEEHQTPPDLAAEVRAFNAPVDANTSTISAYHFPLFLGHALEVLATAADRPQQHTVAAMLDRGLRILLVFPGLKACLDGRHELLEYSSDPYSHRWLDHVVPVALPNAELGDKRFVVRVAIEQHRQIGLIAGALGLVKHQCFTLALTAALMGSRYVPMQKANEAMYQTLNDLRNRCEERAHHTDKLLSEMRLSATQPVVTTVPLTIHDVLAGHRER